MIPYGTFTGARFLDDTTFDSKADGRAGVDAKIIAHDSVAIDLTANPDFSQVESDEPQVTINQRFEVFFPEKRPFFLENAGYFQTPINLFFSRRIGDPQIGARATGKLGGWAVGALAIDDRAPGRAVDAADPRFGDRAVNGVVRVRREIGESSFGALITSRDFGPSSNRVASLDSRVKLNSRIFVDGQAIVSDDQSGDGERRDSAFSASLNRSGRKFSLSTNYQDIGAELPPQPRVRAAHRHPPGDRVHGAAVATQDRADPVDRAELVRPGDVGSRRRPPGLDGAVSAGDRVPRPVRHLRAAHRVDGALRRGSSSASTRTWSTTSRAGSAGSTSRSTWRRARAPTSIPGTGCCRSSPTSATPPPR